MLISDLSSTQMMLLILPILPNMWALKHCFHRDFPTEKEKYRWMMACVFLPCIGGIAYFLVGRRHASKEKINVFERYKKEQPAAASPAEDPALEPAPVEAAPILNPEDALEYEERARAPWDAEPEGEAKAGQDAAQAEEEVPAEAAPSPRKGEWDFGCPEDIRKN